MLSLLISCFFDSNMTKNKTSEDNNTLVQSTRKKDLSDPANTLTGKTETLQLYYIVFVCTCANWVYVSALSSGVVKIGVEKLKKHAKLIDYFWR
jgi:hypothetical protein